MSDSVSGVVDPKEVDAYCGAVVMLSFMVGLIHLVMAAVRAGELY